MLKTRVYEGVPSPIKIWKEGSLGCPALFQGQASGNARWRLHSGGPLPSGMSECLASSLLVFFVTDYIPGHSITNFYSSIVFHCIKTLCSPCYGQAASEGNAGYKLVF